MVLNQSIMPERIHERRPRRRSSYPPEQKRKSIPPEQKEMEKEALFREGAFYVPGTDILPTPSTPVISPAEPVVLLEEAISQPENDASAVVSLVGGALSVFAFLLGFITGAFFYMAPVFALASAVLGIVSYSRIRSRPLELKGAKLALAGALLGSIVLAAYLGWFGVYGLGQYVQAAHYPVL